MLGKTVIQGGGKPAPLSKAQLGKIVFNSLVISINGTEYTFECHSHAKAVEILASHYELWQTMEDKPTLDSFELV